MRELELDGIHDDGDHVVLVDSDGEKYTMRIDEALRAAVRRDRPALGAIRAEESTPLRPRDIQAMLRAGRDVEEIAEIADVEVSHVRRYQGPVLAERGYTAERACRFPVGRGGGPALAEVVTERLRARHADPQVRWDAWRLDDGTWTLQLRFSAGGRPREAHWTVDLQRQCIVGSEDDEARWLIDDDQPIPERRRGRARLTSLKRSVYDVEADGDIDGEVEHAGPRGRADLGSARSEHPSAIDEDELEALNARRGLRPVPPPESSVWSSLEDEDLDADPVDTGAAESEPADDEARREHAELPEPEGLFDVPAPDAPYGDPRDGDEQSASFDPEDPSTADGAQDAGDETSDTPEPAAETQDTVELTPLPGFDAPAAPAASSAADEKNPDDQKGTGKAKPEPAPASKSPSPSKSSKAKSSSKRSSIPSWDEIVFGSKND